MTDRLASIASATDAAHARFLVRETPKRAARIVELATHQGVAVIPVAGVSDVLSDTVGTHYGPRERHAMIALAVFPAYLDADEPYRATMRRIVSRAFVVGA